MGRFEVLLVLGDGRVFWSKHAILLDVRLMLGLGLPVHMH